MYVGIEIGGTKLQLGLGPGDGTLTALWRGGVDVARGGEGIREQILDETPALLQRAGVSRAQVQDEGRRRLGICASIGWLTAPCPSKKSLPVGRLSLPRKPKWRER